MTKSIQSSHFNKLLKEINHGIIEGYSDEMTDKLVEAIDFYEENALTIPFINIFDKASNVIEAVSKRALFLEQLKRIILLSKLNGQTETLSIYYRYYALAQAFYGAPKRGLSIIEEAEKILDINTGAFIELRNAKALIYSEISNYEESLRLYELNYKESKRLDYKPGFRFLHNIGTAYKDLDIHDKAISYIKLGIEYDLQLGYSVNAVTAMMELTEVYLKINDYDRAQKTLDEVSEFNVMTKNQYLYKSYCELMYDLNKATKDYEKALYYHELLMSLEIQLNMDRYSGMIAELNMKYDLTETETENEIIKSKNYDLEVMSKRLENMNKFLKTTLQKSNDIQKAYQAKNDELESTMASLNQTQEKLLLAEKRNVLDQMFINIAHHMSTPLGVMTTTLSHLDSCARKLIKHYSEGKLTKSDLSQYLHMSEQSIDLLSDSTQRVVGFIETLRLYKHNKEDEAVEINLFDHLTSTKQNYAQFKGIEDMEIKCVKDVHMTVNVTLLDKCIDLIGEKLLANSERKGFDIEVSKEINMIAIGLGDFRTKTEQKEVVSNDTLVDSYDYYIIQTIVENLLNGRFIKFKDRGRDYFQFIFQEN